MTSSEFAGNRDNFCYRHPDRQSFVLCQRCLRTVCPECQTPAPVGVICPECMKNERKAESPAQRRARRRWRGGGALAASGSGRPIVTYAIIAITTFVGLLQLIPGAFGTAVTNALAFNGAFLHPELFFHGSFEPWRLLSPVLVHSGFPHLALNMLALWMIGRSLEPMLGRWRYLTLYVLGGIGGSVAVACLAPTTWTVGASGAVFALMGALLVIGRHIGANVTGILVILGINFAMGFFLPSISWQAHLGGALVGALVGFILARTRRRDQRRTQILLLVAVGVGLGAIVAFVPPLVLLA